MRVSVVSFPMLIGHTTLGILPSRGSGSGGGAIKRGSLGSIKMPSAIGHPSAGGVCSFSACLSVWLRWHLYIYQCKLPVCCCLSSFVIACHFSLFLRTVSDYISLYIHYRIWTNEQEKFGTGRRRQLRSYTVDLFWISHVCLPVCLIERLFLRD